MKFPAMFDYESVFVQISNNYPLLVRSNNPSISFLFPKKKIAKNPPWIIEMSQGFSSKNASEKGSDGSIGTQGFWQPRANGTSSSLRMSWKTQCRGADFSGLNLAGWAPGRAKAFSCLKKVAEFYGLG